MNDDNKEFKWSLKYLLNDESLVRDIKTVVSFVLAYGIAVVSNGLIEGFTPAALISVAVSLGAFGTFFAVRIITNEFTDRGMFDEEESNKDLKELIKLQRELSNKLNVSKSYDILAKYNQEKYEYLKQVKYDSMKDKLSLEVKRLESLILHTKTTRKFKWFNRINAILLSRLKRQKNKVSKKLANLSLNNIYVKYSPITLQQLKVSETTGKETHLNESQRFNITPQGEIRKRMAVANFIKTFFFVGFQGAAIATIASWREFIIFLILMSATLATTALSSYVNTRRYAKLNFVGILDEKIQKIKWLLEEEKKYQEVTIDEPPILTPPSTPTGDM